MITALTPIEEQPTETVYHVFSNSLDEWVKTITAAFEIVELWAEEYGVDNFRIYEEERELDGEMINENCIVSFGSFPY